MAYTKKRDAAHKLIKEQYILMKKKQKERTLVLPLLLIMLLSVLEPVLIISGVLPPISTYSPGNILFGLAGYGIVAYLAFSRADEGVKKSAINGAVLGFTSVSITCASALVGTNFYEQPVIGISTGSQQPPLLMLILLIVESTVLVALFSALVTWLTSKFKQKPKRPSPR